MAFFGDKFLDELRAALPVHAVVSRRHKLRKRAAHEWVATDDNSLTVNDDKNIWNDFSKGKGGDVFAFEQHATGCTFEQAVETLAAVAGIALPSSGRKRRAAPAAAPAPDEAPEPPPHPGGNGAGAPASGQKRISAAYPYVDADGALRYEVVRMEWTADGRARKAFAQRRPVPGEPGRWIWGLGAGLYLRGRNGDFYLATEERLTRWAGAERATFESEPHLLYRFPQLREEMAQDPSERRSAVVCEGEKDCATLEAWGCLATTNSGGAKAWQPHHAEELRDADAVVLLDNDRAGRERGHMVAASLRGVARRVRVLDWREHWPGAPDKADVTDWRDQAGGTADKLFAIVDRLPDWTPQPPESRFGALRFVDLDRPARELEWLVKGVITRGEMSIWYGVPGCGKSYLLTDLAFAVARGIHWMGQRTRPGLVIYQAGEGQLGFRKRMRAYRIKNQLPADDDLPFVLLPVRVNLYLDDAPTQALIAEIKAWAAFYDMPLELVVIDTFNAASPGANENASEDVSRVLERARRISTETGAHVAVVHHTPKGGGSPRGHSSLMGNVDSAIEIDRTDQFDEEQKGDGDVTRREIRQFVVRKQKEAEDGLARMFVLKQIVLEQDRDGDDRTACVVAETGRRIAASREAVIPRGWSQLNENNVTLVRCLVRALRKKGRLAPAGVEAPLGARVVTIGEWQAEALELQVGHVEEITATLRNTVRKRIQRACERWGAEGLNLVGKSREFVWRTERKIHQVDDPPAPPREAKPLLAPEEDPRDIEQLLA